MNMLNEKIIHSLFGEGTVNSVEEGRLSIQFSEKYGVRQFVYPDAFECHLKVCNPKIEAEILKDINMKKERKTAAAEKTQMEYEEKIKNIEADKVKAATEKRKTAKKAKE